MMDTRIRLLLETKGMTEQDLATKLELSTGYVERLMTGQRPWPVALVLRVAKLLEVAPREIDPGLEGLTLN